MSSVGDVYSEAPHVGRGGWTWYTGSAGWMYRAGIEWLLGIRVRGPRLVVESRASRQAGPDSPPTLRHRSARYEITVENPGRVCRGVAALELDGVPLDDRTGLPLADDQRTPPRARGAGRAAAGSRGERPVTPPAGGPGGSDDPGIVAVAAKAAELIPDGARVGLGSGRAASAFIARLGARRREGLQVSGVATSRAAAALAERAGIPLIALGVGGPLDLTVDGADEVAPNLDLVKGWGGALVHERIVAAASVRQVIVVGPEKLVRSLGARGRIPVEVIPLAEWLVAREFAALDLTFTRRSDASGSRPFVTDNGNIILDCAPAEPLRDAVAARELHRALRALTGVVDTGLFLGTAALVLVGHPDGRVDVLSRHDLSAGKP